MKRLLLSATLALTSGLACADGYLGGAWGWTDMELDCRAAAHCDDTDTGFKVYGGVLLPNRTFPTLALEASYIDFGRTRATASVVGHSLSVSAITAAAAGRYKFSSSLSGVARLGLAYVSAKTQGSLGAFQAGSNADHSLTPYLGLGLEYVLNRQFKLIGAMDFTSFDSGSESGAVRLFGAGVQYDF
jgi:hypothetical protein